DGAGRRAIHRALLLEAGTAGPIETYRFDGKTDPQIVRGLLGLAGHPEATDEQRIEAVCRRYVELLSAELGKPTQATRLMVGVAELLAALEPHEREERAVVGLLTGNLEPGAALKLRSAGLDLARFRVGAYGSDSHRRADLPALAAQRAALLTGRTFTGADVVILGDTPEDVTCGRALEARDEVLRMRIFRPADGAPAFGVLGWKGSRSQRGHYRHRPEVEARVSDGDAVVTVLERLGFAVSLRIDRTVEIYRLGQAVLRIEWYPVMDVLLEVEGEPAEIERAIAATGLPRDRF